METSLFHVLCILGCICSRYFRWIRAPSCNCPRLRRQFVNRSVFDSVYLFLKSYASGFTGGGVDCTLDGCWMMKDFVPPLAADISVEMLEMAFTLVGFVLET